MLTYYRNVVDYHDDYTLLNFFCLVSGLKKITKQNKYKTKKTVRKNLRLRRPPSCAVNLVQVHFRGTFQTYFSILQASSFL